MNDERNITVVFSTDDKYAIPTYIAVYSLLENYKQVLPIDIIILIKNECVLEPFFPLFYSLQNGFENVNITFVSTQSYFDTTPIKGSYITTATMYRLLIPKFANAKKVIYLDSDTVVEDDISNLFDIDVEGFCVAGVRDLSFPGGRNEMHNESIGIPDLSKYINAGVLLYNVERINKLCLDNELIHEGSSNVYKYNDQDVINSVLYKEIKIVSFRYNVMSSYVLRNDNQIINLYGKQDLLSARKTPVVYHYAGLRKPWVYKHMTGADRWWKYINMQNPQLMEAYILPFIRGQEANLWDTITERVESRIKQVKLYPVCKMIAHGSKKDNEI